MSMIFLSLKYKEHNTMYPYIKKGKGKVKHISCINLYLVVSMCIPTAFVDMHNSYYIHVQTLRYVIHELKGKSQNLVMVTLSVTAVAIAILLCYT